MVKILQIVAVLFGLILVAAALVLAAPYSVPDPRSVDWKAQLGGPIDSVRVFWVGNGLLTHKDATVDSAEDVIGMIEAFAKTASLTYAATEHTRRDAPLSALWRGAAHADDRPAPGIVDRRLAFESNSGAYDALVMTEGVPIDRMITSEEFSAFYAQLFYCALIRNNPNARVYLYETWSSFQAGARDRGYGPRARWNWRQRLSDDRVHWERLADLAGTGRVPAPDLVARLNRLLTGDDGQGCEPKGPVFLIPGATVFAELHDVLNDSTQAGAYRLPDGRPLRPKHLFQNPRAKWPAAWPLPTRQPLPDNEAEILERLPLLVPEQKPDDLHPSQVGNYLAALTHFAVIFRRSPVGLPAVQGVGSDLARRLQKLVWRVVTREPRTGVRPP